MRDIEYCKDCGGIKSFTVNAVAAAPGSPAFGQTMNLNGAMARPIVLESSGMVTAGAASASTFCICKAVA